MISKASDTLVKHMNYESRLSFQNKRRKFPYLPSHHGMNLSFFGLYLNMGIFSLWPSLFVLAELDPIINRTLASLLFLIIKIVTLGLMGYRETIKLILKRVDVDLIF